MIGTLLFAKKYALILTIAGSLIASGGVVVWINAWANQRCTDRVEEARYQAEEQAAENRARITEDFMREQRGYEARLRILRGQIDDVANDNPACLQQPGVARLLNRALPGAAEPPGSIDGAARPPDPDP